MSYNLPFADKLPNKRDVSEDEINRLFIIELQSFVEKNPSLVTLLQEQADEDEQDGEADGEDDLGYDDDDDMEDGEEEEDGEGEEENGEEEEEDDNEDEKPPAPKEDIDDLD